jgi:hypothetical protein
MRVRRVRLRVRNVPWMTDYHGREARLVGEVVDAVELDTGDSDGVLAYVDDRDGEASELAEAWAYAAGAGAAGARMLDKVKQELMAHAKRRFLHGDVIGVRT